MVLLSKKILYSRTQDVAVHTPVCLVLAAVSDGRAL